MIVNNVAVTPVFALWYITMCAGHVSQLYYFTMVYKSLRKNPLFTFVTFVLGSRLRTDAPPNELMC